MTLFDPGPLPIPDPGPVLSVDQRRTQRNLAAIARGRHPATLLPLLDPDWHFTCGQCNHHVRITGGNRTYSKCDVSRLGLSASAASDIRQKWPACTQFRLDSEYQP